MTKLLKSNCMFGAAFAVDRDAILENKADDTIAQEKIRRGIDMGLMISSVKGWRMRAGGNLADFDLNLIVLTPEELRELLERVRGNSTIWDEEAKSNERSNRAPF